MDASDDWRTGCNDVAATQNKARKEARFTDVQFVMGEGPDKRVFNVHKAIMACGSPVFEKMFYGALAETKSIIETDDDPEAFEMLLNYIYGNGQKPTSMSSAWKYYLIGDKYLVTKVHEIAKEYIKSIPFTKDAFWDLIQNKMFTVSLFAEEFKAYMMTYASQIIASEKFLDVPETIIDNILQMDKINVSEYQLLLAITKWVHRNVVNASSKDFARFYKHIRFSTFKMDEFFEFIALFPSAIDVESSLKILQHLHKPYVRNLPRWCSPIHVSRRREFMNVRVSEPSIVIEESDGRDYNRFRDYWFLE